MQWVKTNSMEMSGSAGYMARSVQFFCSAPPEMWKKHANTSMSNSRLWYQWQEHAIDLDTSVWQLKTNTLHTNNACVLLVQNCNVNDELDSHLWWGLFMQEEAARVLDRNVPWWPSRNLHDGGHLHQRTQAPGGSWTMACVWRNHVNGVCRNKCYF